MPFQRITILGCGLIGGSFALALKQAGFVGEIVGWGREAALERAQQRGAIDRGVVDLAQAVADADLVYLSTPVGAILELLPQVGQVAKAGALVTDAGSTKVAICAKAKEVLPKNVTFLGGHPLTGKETSGIENADANLFVGAKYVVIKGAEEAEEEFGSESVREFLDWLRRVGAEPVVLDAETHDRAVALTSHLPQLLSTALAAAVADETDQDELPVSLAAGGFRDMVRLASSPYEIWRDICATNSENISRALERLEHRLARLRARLQSPELAEEFEKAQQVCSLLKANDGRKNDG
jgi:prephenate dehydrogenase